jgi:hypothetical protein
MSQRFRFQRLMAHLALSAALAMMAVPTLGRLAGSGVQGAESTWAALCTAAGLERVAIVLPDGGRTPGQPHAPHPGSAGGDCAYCPLLASILLLVFAWLAMPLQARCERWQFPWQSGRTAFAYPCGLGSRGPPAS